MSDYKYIVEVIKLDKPIRVPRKYSEKFKGILSARKIRRMKYEAVECPVMKKRVAFLECYFCPNFVRRVMGLVYCRGNALNTSSKY